MGNLRIFVAPATNVASEVSIGTATARGEIKKKFGGAERGRLPVAEMAQQNWEIVLYFREAGHASRERERERESPFTWTNIYIASTVLFINDSFSASALRTFELHEKGRN